MRKEVKISLTDKYSALYIFGGNAKTCILSFYLREWTQFNFLFCIAINDLQRITFVRKFEYIVLSTGLSRTNVGSGQLLHNLNTLNTNLSQLLFFNMLPIEWNIDPVNSLWVGVYTDNCTIYCITFQIRLSLYTRNWCQSPSWGSSDWCIINTSSHSRTFTRSYITKR